MLEVMVVSVDLVVFRLRVKMKIGFKMMLIIVLVIEVFIDFRVNFLVCKMLFGVRLKMIKVVF